MAFPPKALLFRLGHSEERQSAPLHPFVSGGVSVLGVCVCVHICCVSGVYMCLRCMCGGARVCALKGHGWDGSTFGLRVTLHLSAPVHTHMNAVTVETDEVLGVCCSSSAEKRERDQTHTPTHSLSHTHTLTHTEILISSRGQISWEGVSPHLFLPSMFRMARAKAEL